MHREISPLKQADDAVLIDSSNYTIEEVAKKIIDCYSKV
jgi:cytidylate kinase